MKREARENLAAYLAVMLLIWPACWLLFGLGPRVFPLWRLVGFYAFTTSALPMTWAVLSAMIDEVLEWCFGTERPS